MDTGNAAREALENSDLAASYTLTETVLYAGLASTIYLSTQRESGLKIGLKVILKSTMDSEELRRARLEIDLHSAVPTHPNILQLLAALETNDAFLLATPYTPKGDLWQITQFGTTYCETEVRNCAAQMYTALNYIHSECDILHGDIKPHNFLLFLVDTRHVVQLCDFGLADRPATPGGLFPWTGLRGTSGWFSPELIRGEQHGFLIDVFGVGLILFRMLGGYAPFDPPCNFEPVEFDRMYWVHVSLACQNFLQQVLAFEPEQRSTAADARAHEWLSGPPPPEPTTQQLDELCRCGPKPCSTFLFWPAEEEVPPQIRQWSYVEATS